MKTKTSGFVAAKQSCSECLSGFEFSDPANLGKKLLQCRYNPPQLLTIGNQMITAFPTVPPDWFCSCYLKRFYDQNGNVKSAEEVN